MGRGHHGRKKSTTKEAAETTCGGAEAPEGEGAAADSARAKTMSSFLRSRLYKAKSLGSLVKERILVEASHCQYEIWKRFGRKGDVNQNSGSSASASGFKRYVSSASTKHHCTSKECPKKSAATATLVQPISQHCTSC